MLDVGCGPGNFTCALAEAGFNVTGLDSYGPLVGSAKGKRRARHLANLAFRQGRSHPRGNTFRDGAFDQVVSIHALYAHPTPDRLLREAHRVLKPGGHAVFVNHTQRIGQWPTLREIARRDGLAVALQGLLWVLLNSIFEATARACRTTLLGRGDVFGAARTGRLRGPGHAEDLPRRRQPPGVGAEERRDHVSHDSAPYPSQPLAGVRPAAPRSGREIVCPFGKPSST